MFKFMGSFIFEYDLKVLTGLRIGGSKENFDIGGLDNPVIKTYISIPSFYGDGSELPKNAPYIPGSSLKGKIRSLLEWSLGRVESMIGLSNGDIKTAGAPCKCGECDVCVLFGTGDAKTLENISTNKQPGPPRLIFSDAYPTKETLDKLQKELGEGIFTEIKTENQINRITSRANPRKVERVPAGAVFKGRIVFNMFKEEDKDRLGVLLQGLRMLEDNFLGGYGSRGSGRVKFEKIEVEFKDKNVYLGKEKQAKKYEFKTLDEIKLEELLKLCS